MYLRHKYEPKLLNELEVEYPKIKELFNKIALDCDKCRVKAGIHYISDGEFSRTLFKMFNT